MTKNDRIENLYIQRPPSSTSVKGLVAYIFLVAIEGGNKHPPGLTPRKVSSRLVWHSDIGNKIVAQHVAGQLSLILYFSTVPLRTLKAQ